MWVGVCVCVLVCDSLLSPIVLSCPSDIDSLAVVSLTEHFVPSLPGKRKLMASLDCEQLTQVHGVAEITVEGRRLPMS